MRALRVLLVVILAGVALTVGVAQAAPPDNGPKVTICHRRAAVTNPYGPQPITVDQSSIFNNGIVPNGHGTHTGPIFPATGPDGKWGDIIPPFDGYPGQNFTAEGQAILANGCQIPGPPPTTTPPTTAPPTTAPPTTTPPTTSPPTSPATTRPSAPTTPSGVSPAAAAAARFFAATAAQRQALIGAGQARAAAPVVGAPRTTG
jgi:hypothetical protein